MTDDIKAHQIVGDATVFAKCRGDKKFVYVVTLARAVNALNSAHSLMRMQPTKTLPPQSVTSGIPISLSPQSSTNH